MIGSKRNPALDVVRIVATICVITFHCIGRNGLYDVYMVGTRMYLLCILQAAVTLCVPLFIILTGYLMRKKRLNKKFYGGIVKTLVIYAMAATVCEIVKYGMPGKTFLAKLTSGRGTGYSWYVAMYMGLFLIIPFLNMMYRGDFSDQGSASAKKYKRSLIASLLALTALPPAVNIFVFDMEWWKNPTISTEYLEILTTFWVSMYPVTYYMIGCYLAEYGLKLRRSVCGLLLAAVILVNGSHSFLRSCGMEYASGSWLSYGSLAIVIQSTLAFQWIASANTQNWSNGVQKLLKILSDLCFGAYLVSQIFETLFYPMFAEAVPSVGLRMNYYPLMVGMVFVCSMALSGGLHLVYEGIHRGAAFLIGKMPKPIK